MPWEQYVRLSSAELARLLDSDAVSDEKPFQKFLERNPCFVPGALQLGSPSGHFPFPCAMFTQPILPGLPSKKPDFMWLATDSATFRPSLVEIEAPGKHWFNKDGSTTAHFNHAKDQIAQWRAWFNKPENQMVFYETYQVPEYLRKRTLCPEFLLIYGRRSEANLTDELMQKRDGLAGPNEYHKTYDSLAPNYDARYFPCVTIKAPRNFVAVQVPPTMMIGAAVADEWSRILELDQAIDACQGMTDKRRLFLKERMKYWTDKANRIPDLGSLRPTEYE